MEIRKANIDEVVAVVSFIDNTFTKEGFGFVTSAQIKTETKRGAVWIALENNQVIGVRVGKQRVYNLAVHPDYRRMGIGEKLIYIYRPEVIRVKAIPIGHLSKQQINNFKSPRKFYEKIGFVFRYRTYAKNFWQRGKDKAHFHKVGKKKHIEIYKDKDPKQRRLFKTSET